MKRAAVVTFFTLGWMVNIGLTYVCTIAAADPTAAVIVAPAWPFIFITYVALAYGTGTGLHGWQRSRSRPARKPQNQPAATPERLAFRQPGDLATCPTCHLMAHHHAKHHTPIERSDVEIFVWNSAEPVKASSPYWRLTCVFCHHEWREEAVRERT